MWGGEGIRGGGTVMIRNDRKTGRAVRESNVAENSTYLYMYSAA